MKPKSVRIISGITSRPQKKSSQLHWIGIRMKDEKNLKELIEISRLLSYCSKAESQTKLLNIEALARIHTLIYEFYGDKTMNKEWMINCLEQYYNYQYTVEQIIIYIRGNKKIKKRIKKNERS